MDRIRAQDLVRKGFLAYAAKDAFEDNLDQDGTSKGGGRQYKKKHPVTGNPQPSQYSFDQPSASLPQAGQYPQGYYPQANHGQAINGYSQAASGAPQYPPYSSSPPQAPRPPSCLCTLCQHCTGHFADCFDSQSQLYYCRDHRGYTMTWTNPGMGSHNCPSNHSPPPPNQYSYSTYQQPPSTSGPSYGSGSGQGYGVTTRDVYRDSTPRSFDDARYQGSPPPDYGFGRGYTQEPAQLPDQGQMGEASDYYNQRQYHPTYPRVRDLKSPKVTEADLCE